MKTKFLFLLLILIIQNINQAQKTSPFNEEFLRSIVSIEKLVNNEYYSVGTGFIVESPNKHVVLVTAKHIVLDKFNNTIPELYYRLNIPGRESLVFKANHPPKYKENKGWFISDEYDVACRFIRFAIDSDIKFLKSENFMDISWIKPATDVLILGFPLGLRSKKYAKPIVKRGIVARNDSTNIMLDALVYPGNSGGPVFYYSPFVGFENPETQEKLIKKALVGLVSNYIPYTDIAISNHTKRPRITFEENSGLCNIVPSKAILELFQSKKFIEVDNNFHLYR